MKKIVILFIIISLLGCSKKMEGKNENIQMTEIIKNFNIEEILINKYNLKINNSLSVSSLNKEYMIEDLSNYFGLYSYLESYYYENNNFKGILEINEKFPIELLKSNNGVIYAVYKVKDGGYFYLFFGLYDNEIVLSNPIYIDELKNKKDFDCLDINQSTYEDLFAISSASTINFLLSHGTYSYTLLDDGTFLEVGYDWSGHIRDRKDLVVNSISVVSDASTDLQYIYKSDLPI